MTKKIGDIAIAITILLFLVVGTSFVFTGFDDGLGVTSSVTNDFEGLSTGLQNVSNMQKNFYDAVDNTSTVVTDPDTEDTEVSDAPGFINLFSKNILVRFVQLVAYKLNIPGIVIALILGLIGIIITVLIIRAVAGDGRI